MLGPAGNPQARNLFEIIGDDFRRARDSISGSILDRWLEVTP